MLLGDRFGASIAALLGGVGVIAGAIEADAEIGAALEAGFASAGLAGQSPFESAFPAVASHEKTALEGMEGLGPNLGASVMGEVTICAMRQEYHVLLDATIAHLEELKAGGIRHVPVRSETLAMLSSPQAVVAARVVSAEARVEQGQAEGIVNKEGKDAPGVSLDEKERAMALLRERVMVCRKCASLADARQSVVFGVGDVHSPLMFVGEAPGADEDERGEPFVGKAGQLLTRIIQTMGFDRDTVFIANILKCRPDTPGQSAGNRKPTAGEMATCLPYLLEQIEIVRPRVIVALGATAVEGLLGLTTGITRLRGRWVEFRGIPVMPTYHPAYLLRNQSLPVKRQVWEDMLQVLERLGRPISEKQRGFFLKP